MESSVAVYFQRLETTAAIRSAAVVQTASRPQLGLTEQSSVRLRKQITVQVTARLRKLVAV